jgi:hypothetical protein
MKTHSFNGEPYEIEVVDNLLGICISRHEAIMGKIIIEKSKKQIDELDTAIHEALHAIGIPDKYLHNKDGTGKVDDVARFIWRLGWRKNGK